MASTEEIEEGDFSFAAYNQLRELTSVSPSLSFCHKRLRAEIAAEMSPNSPKDTFIPFVRERNSLGKLLRSSESSPKRSPIHRQSSIPVVKRTNAFHSPKLRRRQLSPATPGVGTYTTEKYWERKSYWSRKSAQSHSLSPKVESGRKLPNFHPQKTPLVPVYQYVAREKEKRETAVDKFEALKPEVALRRMKKTNFQSVKLFDSPEELMKSFQFQDRRRLKDEKLYEVKRFMRRMLKGKFY